MKKKMLLLGSIGLVALAIAGLLIVSLVLTRKERWEDLDWRNEDDALYERQWRRETLFPTKIVTKFVQDSEDLNDLFADAFYRWKRIDTTVTKAEFFTVDEFERAGGGQCDEWAWWYYIKLLNLGYDARWTIGTFRRKNHAWTTVRIGSRTIILDQTQMTTAGQGEHEPRASYRYNKVSRFH